MVKRLGVQDLNHYTTISKYELDKNEPPSLSCSPTHEFVINDLIDGNSCDPN